MRINFEKALSRFLWLSAFSVFMLFFFGGLVRATESGMGCPDWPKCFGQWIPPVSEADLPPDYQEIYLKKRQEKLDEFVVLLERIGLSQSAARIQSHPKVLEPHPYSFKTAYIEYVNRVFGVLSGLFLIAAFFLSVYNRKTYTRTWIWTGLGLLFVILNGWMGSKVVNTNLVEGMVTVHFLIAFIALGWLILAFRSTQNIQISASGRLDRMTRIVMMVMLILVMAQMLLGAWVRETVEYYLRIEGIGITIENYAILGQRFTIHRVISFVILGLSFVQAWRIGKYYSDLNQLKNTSKIIVGLLLVQLLTGVLNIRMEFPLLPQVGHVTIGALLFVSQFYICTRIWLKAGNRQI
jgi:cytochrome c oxidase assembly protein subunit 15